MRGGNYSPNSNLPLTNIFPVCSDKVPGQRLPRHVPGYVVYSGSNIHQSNPLRVQSVLQVSAR